MCKLGCVAEAVNRVSSALSRLSGWKGSRAPICEACGNLINLVALGVQGKCGGDSDYDLGFEPTGPFSGPARDADVIDSHRAATVDAYLIADKLGVPASGNDETVVT